MARVILNRDLQSARIPEDRAVGLRPAGEGHERAWAAIWRFAQSFDPERYAEQVAALDSAAAYERAKREAADHARLTGSLSELRAALRLAYDDGFGMIADPAVIDALLDAIHAAIAAGAPRPQPSQPALLEAPLGVFGAGVGTGQHRTWFCSRHSLTREKLFDRAAGLLLREVAEGVVISALYLYPPSYPVDSDGAVSHIFMLLLEPRRGASVSEDNLQDEYGRLCAMLVGELADLSAEHYPAAPQGPAARAS